MIVADSSFVVETIRLALKNTARLNVLGKVDGRGSIRTAVGQCRPDIVLVDEMQNSDDCLDRIRECREESSDTTIVLLTMRMDDDWLGEALGAGVDACISKSSHLPSLGTLIREIVSRNIVCAAPRAAAEAAQSLPGGEDLTAREREILTLVAEGLTNATIGKQLWVTEQTVKFHLSNIYRKLGVSNRTEASRFVHTGAPARPRLVEAPAAALTPVHAVAADAA
ncbi:MAG TPA: response regulator transcription factor [Thermoleophilaceae bacterium]